MRSHLLFAVLGAAALVAPVANAGTRCSDDPERCVKSTATLSRPLTRVVAGVASAPVLAPPQVVPTSAQLVRKAAPALRKAPKPQRSAQRTTPAPTPGMGMLLKLSTGSGGDVSSNQGKPSEPSTGQSWVL